jgi:hypothetical protein
MLYRYCYYSFNRVHELTAIHSCSELNVELGRHHTFIIEQHCSSTEYYVYH